MRKISLYKIYFLVSMIIAGLGLSSFSAMAFLLPPTPVSPTTDPGTDVSFYLKGVGSTATNVSAQASAYMQEQTKILKAAKSKYMDKFTGFMGGMFKKKEKKAIPGSKTIKKSKIADIYDPESVKKAMYKLFLAYPTTKKDKMACYRNKRGEFYEDTVIEVYTSVRQLEIQLKEIETEINGLTKTLVAGQGSGGAESNEDDNGVWKNYYTAFETMDELLQITEEVMAMKAQYEAASAVNNTIEPAKKNDKSSSLTDGKIRNNEIVMASNDNANKTVIHSHNDTLMFAQAVIMRSAADKNKMELEAVAQQRKNFEAINNLPKTAKIVNIQAEEDEEDNYEYDPTSNGMVEYVAAPPSNMKSPFAGNEEKMNELEKLTPVYNTAQEAIEIHSVMKSLPTYKETFERYEQFLKLHQRSLEALNNADKCAIQYLGRYYNNPKEVWNGGAISEAQVNEYDLRSGISAWAIKTFELAKSEQAAPISSDDLGEFELDSSIDSSDMGSIEKQKTVFSKQDMVGIANPSKDEELEKINRETGMLNWNIGAEAATLLVQDQYDTAPKWGGINKKFPIWYDQQTFYNQYIDGKYANIKEYIKAIDVNAAALKIAYKLNEVLDDIEDEERQANLLALDKIGSLIEDGKLGDDSEIEARFKALADKKEKSLEKAKFSRDSGLKSYNMQKQAVNAKLDRAAELVKIYNQRINQLSQDALLADNEAETYSKMVKVMKEDEDEDDNIVTYVTKSEQEYEHELTPETEKKVVDYTNDIERNVEKIKVNNSAPQLAKGNMSKAAVSARSIEPEKAKVNLQEVKKQILVPIKAKAGDAAVEEIESYSEFDELEVENAKSSIQPKRQLFRSSPTTNSGSINKLEKRSSYQSFSNLAFAQLMKSEKVQELKARAFGNSQKQVAAKASMSASKQSAVAPMAAKAVLSNAPAAKAVPASTGLSNKVAAKASLNTALSAIDASKTELLSAEKAEAMKFEAAKQDIEPKFKMIEKTEFVAMPVEQTPLRATVAATANNLQNVVAVGNDTSFDKVSYTPVTKEDIHFETQAAVVAKYTRTIESTSSFVDDEEGELMTKARSNISDGEKASLLANQNKDSLREKVKVQNEEIKNLQKEIAKIDADIERVEQSYNAQVQVIETSYNVSVAAEQQKLEDNKSVKKALSLVEIYNSSIKNPLGKFSILRVLGNTDAVVGDSKDYAAEAIERTRGDIMQLGDDLYLARSGKLTAKRHIELMDELNNLPTKQLVSASSAIAGVSGYPDIMNIVSTLYQQALLKEACAGNKCKKTDDDYFVGMMPKARDFMAPKAAPDIFMPPIREVVHFDEVDYTNVPKLTDASVTKDGFLNYGNKVPEIWKLMLKPHAYVEKDIDLSSALSLGGEALTFMRGGRLPCRIDGKVIDADPDNGMYLVYKDNGDDKYPTCQELKLEKSGLLYTVVDIVEDVKGPASSMDKAVNIGTILKPLWLTPNPKVVKASELGVLLKALNNNLYFSKTPHEVFTRLSKVEEELSANNNSYEKNLRDEMYKKSLLKENQIGNFLNFVELETGLRQTRDELAIGIEDAKKRLFAILEKVGFKPKADLNLANPEDYELVRSQLDRLKNKLVSSAYNDAGNINDDDNEVVEERLDKLQRILGALRKDKDELTSISEVTPDDAELDEQIKAEEVNLKVAGEYAKRANDEMNKQLDSFSRPYCAAY